MRDEWTISDGIDEGTKLADLAPFLPYLLEDTIQGVKSAAAAKYGSPWDLSIGQLFAHMKGDFSRIGVNTNKPDELLVLQYYWVESFKEMAEQLIRALESLQPPQSVEAKNASKACRPMSFDEGTMVFLRDYFGLKSFRETRDLHIEDLILAKKDKFNQATFEQTIAKIHEQKIKAKK